jgi:uncharacterized SAM-binding protein YcdF (DUF218 family)
MKKRISLLAGICSIILILVVVAGVLFLAAGAFLVRKDRLKSSEAMAILSGGGVERLEYGASLYDAGIARRIILTETDDLLTGSNEPMANVNLDNLAAQYGIPKARIILTRTTSTSTYEEAQAILELMNNKRWNSLVIVTDSFHSRRTGMIFDKIFKGSGIRISVQPVDVPGYWYNPMKWWWSSESREATLMEYVKIFYFLSGQYEK